MAFGDQFNVMKSLASIDTWIATINDNMQGVSKTGYRARRVTFGGSGEPYIQREATSSPTILLNIARPDQVLNIARLTTDFSAGEITASYAPEHLAINDDRGFFYVTDSINTANGTPTGKYYLTRDGEFHWDNQGFLRTRNGYYVLSGGGAGNDRAYNQLQLFNDRPGGTSDDGIQNGACGVAPRTYSVRLDSSGEAHWFVDDEDTLIPMNVIIPSQALQTLVPLADDPTMFLFSDGLTPATVGETCFGGQVSGTDYINILGYSLENANTSMTQMVPELSLAQKMYQALTKVLQAYQTNLDNAFNVIR